MANRSELREKVMNIIYQISLYKENKISYNPDEIISDNMEIDNEFIKDLAYGVLTYYDELTELANKYLDKWPINRLDKAGGSILRMALYEIKYTDTPDVVVINEAIELAKKYSDDSVRKIINGVLDKVINE